MWILGSMPGLKDSRNGGNGDCENTNDDGDGDTSRRTLPGALTRITNSLCSLSYCCYRHSSHVKRPWSFGSCIHNKYILSQALEINIKTAKAGKICILMGLIVYRGRK